MKSAGTKKRSDFLPEQHCLQYYYFSLYTTPEPMPAPEEPARLVQKMKRISGLPVANQIFL